MTTERYNIKNEHNIDITIAKENEFEYASQWKLMWWSFKKHKLAVISGVIIVLMYLTTIFAEFIAPHHPNKRFSQYITAPPQKIHFFDEKGFNFRPFVYGYKQELNMETFERIYVEDKTRKLPIYFFVKGYEYKFLNLIKTNIHLFGTIEGAPLFIFGTDTMGRDLFSRIIHGGRISMSIGLVGVFLSFVLGLFFGGISGFFGGKIDRLIQRMMEILRCFPKIPLLMGLSAALPSGWSPTKIYFALTIILSIIGWTDLARVARSKIMSLKNEDFVVAARLAGTSEARIISSHLIPSFMSHIIASITLSVPYMILGETSLSFLGIGLRPPVISWGVLMQDAQNIHSVALAPWLLIPGFFVIIFVLAFNFLGDGLRDAADPYSN